MNGHELAACLKAYRRARASEAEIPRHDPRVRDRKGVQGPRQLALIREEPSPEPRPPSTRKPADLLRDAEPLRVGASIPQPLDTRLDALVRTAERAGERTNRRELVAALILATPTAPTELADLLHRYRRAPDRRRRLRG